MDRNSVQHGPRVDEQLDRETRSLRQGSPVEARTEEFREQEGPGEDQPVPDALLQGGRDPASDAGLDHDETEARSELARFLQPSAFPGDRDALLSAAREEQAPASILEQLGRLPDGATFENVNQVWEALGGRTEQRF